MLSKVTWLHTKQASMPAHTIICCNSMMGVRIPHSKQDEKQPTHMIDSLSFIYLYRRGEISLHNDCTIAANAATSASMFCLSKGAPETCGAVLHAVCSQGCKSIWWTQNRHRRGNWCRGSGVFKSESFTMLFGLPLCPWRLSFIPSIDCWWNGIIM